MYLFSAMLGSTVLSSCHTVPVKSCSALVAHSPTEYDVCVDPKTAKIGSRVAIFKEKCSATSRGSAKKCRNEKMVEGSIVRILDDHLSTIKLDEPFELTESMTIQPTK